jgi:AraC-like DNA-binding protein
MLGESSPAHSAALKLDLDREVPLQIGGVSFDELFAQHFAMIREFEKQPDILPMLGLDDALYRTFATLLAPELFFGEKEIGFKEGDHSQLQLDLACEYISTNLNGVLTRSDIERISGMSTRALQYAFMKRFGRTPMQWVQDRRFELVYHRLKHAKYGDTVDSLASGCGFKKLGDFVQNYFRHFHELPSETMNNSAATLGEFNSMILKKC